MMMFQRKNMENIKNIVQAEIGVSFQNEKFTGRRFVVMACCVLCLGMLCAFAYYKFSGLNGDEAVFAAVYQGDGVYDILVVNTSNHKLKLQNKVKVMQWSTGELVPGDTGKIVMDNPVINPNSQGVIRIDISEGYDVETMKKDLAEGDGYYFVLTNNDFAFGQDWMCFFDFEVEQTQVVKEELEEFLEKRSEAGTYEPEYEKGVLSFADWCWPTVSQQISCKFGLQENGSFSDHVNIAGIEGDHIFAVSDGMVAGQQFDSTYGNVIVMDIGDDILVEYGHLKECLVSEGDTVSKGQVIGVMGKSGMATGPNLYFAVSKDGEKINPLQ